MNGIDETIAQVEKLYQTVTGKAPPPSDTPYAPIPAEKDPIKQVEAEIERLLLLLSPQSAEQVAPPWMPALQVLESPTEVVFCVDLPGVKRDQVEVQLQNNVLIVRGSRSLPAAPNQTQQEGALQLRLSEQPLGRFQRVLPLPQGGRPTGYSAQMRDGVLEIRVPRDATPRNETIPVT